ncbi:HAD-IC family P-type ATPase [Patescibacteria group bacterium]|nr:HAD-IC family P-type ATPase [Patescibacteria group bacterium]MBU1722154.1 HAD-IC family P-type ATPase [Patescibacteria group bacterium]MBU1901203.1 HAD-IC family P-type ATPase [Patescibacteria group bacterium]
MSFFNQSPKGVLEFFSVDKLKGLSAQKVFEAQKKYGKNELEGKKEQYNGLKIFISQWKSPLILILIVAGTISGVLHEYVDMWIIYVTAIINVFIGFFQEYKANRALEQLQKMVAYEATVLRDGKKQVISSKELVPGDILFLTAGDKVQVDGRILEGFDFEVNEAALTGESEPIKKVTKKLVDDLTLAERKNMVYRGTAVTEGTAIVVVTAIGNKTELGQIASLVEDTEEEETPLQQQLSKLGKMLSMVVVVIAIGIFVIGMLYDRADYSMLQLFETAVAVAVAAIPEGLVISLTIILAIGMQHILKKKSIVRKLVAAETLGSVSVICTDKTGTLTEGKMRVSACVTASGKHFSFDTHELTDDEKHLILTGLLCNDSSIEAEGRAEKDWKLSGNMTEMALLHAGMIFGMDKNAYDKIYTRTATLPFSSKYKFMMTEHDIDGKKKVFIKGAPEKILARSTYALVNGKAKKMSVKERKAFQKRIEEYAMKGYRTLAFAERDEKTGRKLTVNDAKDLVFVGFTIISDPLRKDVKETIIEAQRAGIQVVMITGDHAKTAASIAEQLGLEAKGNYICTGEELETYSDEELSEKIKQTTVFARVEPRHKIRIVQAFKARGDVVAMTGDGINDAPAIKGADIGIALGSGTDVAKETSDMVLLDDSFSTIASSVNEGRRIYENIRKVVVYLLSGSFAEVVMIVGSIMAGLPVAALPAQILWVNIIEDSSMNITLAFDNADKHYLDDPPRKKGAALIDKEMRLIIILKSILSNVFLFTIFVYFWKTTGDIALTRTLVFVGFAVDSLFLIFSVRSLKRMIWQINFFSNKYLLAAVAFGWTMLFVGVYAPFAQFLLKTVSLEWHHWMLMLVFGFFNMALIETIKWFVVVRKGVK